MDTQGVACSLDYLVRIRIIKRVTRGFRVLERLSLQCRGGSFEVVDAAGLATFLKGKGNRDCAIDFDSGRPEVVVEMDCGKRHRLDGIIPRRPGRQRCNCYRECDCSTGHEPFHLHWKILSGS